MAPDDLGTREGQVAAGAKQIAFARDSDGSTVLEGREVGDLGSRALSREA